MICVGIIAELGDEYSHGWGHFRYPVRSVGTIFAIEIGGISPETYSSYIDLTCGRYLRYRLLKWQLSYNTPKHLPNLLNHVSELFLSLGYPGINR